MWWIGWATLNVWSVFNMYISLIWSKVSKYYITPKKKSLVLLGPIVLGGPQFFLCTSALLFLGTSKKNIGQKNVSQSSYGVLKKKDQSPKFGFWSIEKIYFLRFSPFFQKALKGWRNWVIWINNMGTTRSDQFQKLGKSQILWTCNFFHTFDINKRIVAINYGYSADKIPKVLPKTFDPYFQRRLVFTDIHS